MRSPRTSFVVPARPASQPAEYLVWRGHGIKVHDIGSILWPLSALGATDRHYLVVGFRVFVARECWRWIKEKITDTRDTERGYILPLK